MEYMRSGVIEQSKLSELLYMHKMKARPILNCTQNQVWLPRTWSMITKPYRSLFFISTCVWLFFRFDFSYDIFSIGVYKLFFSLVFVIVII